MYGFANEADVESISGLSGWRGVFIFHESKKGWVLSNINSESSLAWCLFEIDCKITDGNSSSRACPRNMPIPRHRSKAYLWLYLCACTVPDSLLSFLYGLSTKTPATHMCLSSCMTRRLAYRFSYAKSQYNIYRVSGSSFSYRHLSINYLHFLLLIKLISKLLCFCMFLLWS